MERKRNIRPAADRRSAETALRRALAAVMPPEPERRINPRLEALAAQSAETVRLVDLSIHGCCLGFSAPTDYRPGQFIRLGFPGEAEPIRAIVRWTDGPRIGAEFTRSLPGHRIEVILSEERQPLVSLL
jgi:hypothetical protein